MILQDWDELEALRASLREHMAEIKRLNDCLTWEQHRAEHVGTHGHGCAEWGPKHYECLLRAHEALKKRTSQEFRQVEPVAHIAGYKQGYCVIKPVDCNVLLPVGMALYRSPPTSQESRQVEPIGYANKKGLFRCADDADEAFKATAIPLYATPPKREPLTDEEIREIADRGNYVAMTFADGARGIALDKVTVCDLARAIERAHGIGGEE